MGPNFLHWHLKKSDSESDEITLFQGPGTVGLELTTLEAGGGTWNVLEGHTQFR